MTGDRKKKAILGAVAVLALGFAVWRTLRYSVPAPLKQPVFEVDLICRACGHEVRLKPKEMPMKCPACGERALVLAAYCPKCDVTLPLLDSALYIQSSYLARTRYPEKVFPRCPECGQLVDLKYRTARSGGPTTTADKAHSLSE